jgi:hypothetical protein
MPIRSAPGNHPAKQTRPPARHSLAEPTVFEPPQIKPTEEAAVVRDFDAYAVLFKAGKAWLSGKCSNSCPA